MVSASAKWLIYSSVYFINNYVVSDKLDWISLGEEGFGIAPYPTISSADAFLCLYT